MSCQTQTLTTSQALLRYLAVQEVEQIDGSFAPLLAGLWGIYGHGNVAGIGEALPKAGIPFFRGHNEQGMAHAAIAYAKQKRARQIMGVTTSIGPGATNLVTAAALAHVNRLPVLFLPGDVFANRAPDPVLQQLEDPRSQLASVNDCFLPVSRYYDRITRPEQLLAALPQAVSTLLDPVDRGPVTLALPQDVQVEGFEFPESFFEPKRHFITRPRPCAREFERVIAWLRTLKAPLIIAGGGVLYSGAEHLLTRFAERYQIPIAETQGGKSSLPADHPLNVGGIGVTGSSAANALAKEADGIIAIGTRLSDFTTASKSLFHREDCQILQINTSRLDGCKGGLQLQGDAKAILEDLLESVDHIDVQIDPTPYKEEWEAHHKVATHRGGEIPSDAEVLRVVNEVADPGDIVVCAAGGLPGELHKHWRANKPGSYHLEYGYSCMGYEIAGGLGVKLAQPGREVYVLVGDGSYLMLHSEILTAVQMGIKINIVLLDNGGFGCINRLQQSVSGELYGNIHGKSPDFVRNGASYGAWATTATSLENLKARLQANRRRPDVCMTVIKTDPEVSSEGFASWEVPHVAH